MRGGLIGRSEDLKRELLMEVRYLDKTLLASSRGLFFLSKD